MTFFDLKGETKDFSPIDNIGHGKFFWSQVFKLPDGKTVIKIYKEDTYDCYRLSYDTFMFLRTYSNDHLLKLRELLYKEKNFLDKKRTLKKPSKRIVDAYTYDYVKEDNITLVDMPTEYLLTNFNELEQMFTYFAANGLLVYDTSYDNTILTSKNMVIIDPDLFVFVGKTVPYEEVLISNKIRLLKLFKSIVLTEMNANKKLLMNIFDFSQIYNENMINAISKKMELAKNPRELFTSR